MRRSTCTRAPHRAHVTSPASPMAGPRWSPNAMRSVATSWHSGQSGCQRCGSDGAIVLASPNAVIAISLLRGSLTFKLPAVVRPGMDEAYFRERYEADAANKARQPFTEYMDWVKTFYEGKRFPPVPGWRKREEDLLRHHHATHELRHALHDTGRALAAEWAKDNAVRKVTTNDLQVWGKKFEAAAKDPHALQAALEEVRAEVKRRVG